MASRQNRVEAPVEYSDEALAEAAGDELSPEAFALRVEAKREAAMQDAGWLVPRDETQVEPLSDEERARFTIAADEQPEQEIEQPFESEEEGEQAFEEEPEEGAEEQPEAEGDGFFFATYRTPEAAEAGFAEKDRLIAAQFRRVHELEQLLGQQQEQSGGAAELDVQAWHEWAAEQVERGAGEQAALQAYQTGGRDAYNIVLAYWLRDPEQMGDALAFNNELQTEIAAQAGLAAARPLLEEQQLRSAALEAQSARDQVRAQHPDFDEYQERMDAIIREPGLLSDEMKTFIAEIARGGGEQGKRYVWDYLYMVAKSSAAPARRRAQRTADEQARASGEQARVRATVSTAEGAATRTPSSTARERDVINVKNSLRKEWGLPLLDND